VAKENNKDGVEDDGDADVFGIARRCAAGVDGKWYMMAKMAPQAAPHKSALTHRLWRRP
jgi:hypothetical protein